MPARIAAAGPSGRTRSAKRPAAASVGDERSQVASVVVDEPVVACTVVRGRRELHDQRPESELARTARSSARATVRDSGTRRCRRRPARRCGSAAARGSLRASSAWASSASRYFFCGTSAACSSSASSDAVGRDQIARALFADAGHALDVVDRVAHQREHVDDLVRRDAELLLHAAGVVPRAFVARVEDADAVAARAERSPCRP